MSVKDVIKKSVLNSDQFNQAISANTIETIVIDLLVALLLGFLIYEVYKHFYKGVVYSKNFAITLVGMTVLTAMVTLAISTNIVISLGMVGALSIVRYRTAIKEPLDLMYLFWAITSGITAGAGMYILAAAAFLVMLLVVWAFSSKKSVRDAYILVVHYTGSDTGDRIMRELSKTMKPKVRSKTCRTLRDSGSGASASGTTGTRDSGIAGVSENGTETVRDSGTENYDRSRSDEDDWKRINDKPKSDTLTELTIQIASGRDTTFVEHIKTLPGVRDVTLLKYDGEYHG
ncbi:MAG: DUF4956 domain-containing protein [Lachnospiraceae bacterium]|nr:DUF4956 domain-containing protein [Lachnospiraceae bacterium]